MKSTKFLTAIVLILAFFVQNQNLKGQCGNKKVAMHLCWNHFGCKNYCIPQDQVDDYRAMGYTYGHCNQSTCFGGPFFSQNNTDNGTVTEMTIDRSKSIGSCFCNIPGFGCRDYDWKCREKCFSHCQHHSNITDASGNITQTVSSAAKITFATERTENISFIMYDISGRPVKVLANGPFETGFHSITIDIKNESIAPGTYVIKLESALLTEFQKIIITD